MIQFTYDQAYKLRFDIKESLSKKDPALKHGVSFFLGKIVDDYVVMCQTLPMTTNPNLIIEDRWADKLTHFYKYRKN